MASSTLLTNVSLSKYLKYKFKKTSFSKKNNKERAANGTRTRDPNLGKVVLYQLSYCRNEKIVKRRRLELPRRN